MRTRCQDSRHILIVLADSLESLEDMAGRLASGAFRDAIVSESLGVIAAN